MTQELSITQMKEVAIEAHKSGLYKLLKNDSEAFVKVAAGAELGIPPFASISGIHVVEGKPTLSSNLLAGLVKQSGKYDYRCTEKTAKQCVIQFYEGETKIGTEIYTEQMAQNAGLAGKGSWAKYAEQMLFARCISSGVRTHCPEVAIGGVYVHGEIEGTIEAETRTEIDITPAEQPNASQHPMDAVPEKPSALLNARAAYAGLCNYGKAIVAARMPDAGITTDSVASVEKHAEWMDRQCREQMPKDMLASVMDYASTAMQKLTVPQVADLLKDIDLTPDAVGLISVGAHKAVDKALGVEQTAS